MQRNRRVSPDTQVRSPSRSFIQSLDNFYGSSRDTRSEQATQRGLGALEAVAGQQLRRAKDQRNAEEFNQGTADAEREAAGLELQGVKTGNIFRQHSSFYTQGLNEQRGKSAAFRFKNELETDYQNWEGRFSDDPEEFRSWIAERNGAFLAGLEDNPTALAAALPVIQQAGIRLTEGHTQFTNDRLRQEHITAFGDVLNGYMDSFNNGEIDQEQLWTLINMETDGMYDIEGAEADALMVDAMIQYADTFDDPNALLTLAEAHTKGKIKLSRAGMLKVEQAADRLEAEIDRQQKNLDEADREAYKAQVKALNNNLVQNLIQDPYLDVVEFWRENGNGDASLLTELRKTQDNYQAARKNSQPPGEEVTAAFRMELYQAKTMDAKMAVLQKYTGPGGITAAQWEETFDAITQMDSGEGVLGNRRSNTKKDLWLTNVASLASEDGFADPAQVGRIEAWADMEYTNLLMEYSQGIDPSDFNAIDTIHEKVQSEVNQALLSQFPAFYSDNILSSPDAQPLAEQTGLQDTQNQIWLREEQERAANAGIASDAMGALADTAEQGPPEPTPEQAAEMAQEADQPARGDSVGNNVLQDGLAIAGEAINAVIGANPAAANTGRGGEARARAEAAEAEVFATEDPQEAASQPDTFYTSLLDRLTDGEINDTPVSSTVLVETAKRVLGADERAQNGLLKEFLADGGVNLDPAKTAWCAAFMNAVLRKNGVDGTDSNMARSFMRWGQPVSGEPQSGDIVVFSRTGDPRFGHVGFFQGYDSNGNILVLGGNQGNRVSVAPYSADRLLGFRRAVGAQSGADNIQAMNR